MLWDVCMTHGRARCAECEYVFELEQENARLREALRFYADKENYIAGAYWRIVIDEGETARKALEGQK